MPQLPTALTQLTGVGEALASKLNKLNIHDPVDLLFHLPRAYQDRTRITPLGDLKIAQEALVQGEIIHSEITRTRRRMLVIHVQDDTGVLLLRFFHFYPNQQQQLRPGVRVRCFGEIRSGMKFLEIIHPEYQVIKQDQPLPNTLTPIYPITEGITQARLRGLLTQVLPFVETLPEGLPTPLLQELGLPSLATALTTLHTPPPDINLLALLQQSHPAQKRLAFEELLAHRLSLRLNRREQHQHHAPAFSVPCTLQTALLQHLPFALTNAQQRVIAEINADLTQTQPMLRLLQGDVGAGKTLVAMMAALPAIAAGYQVAVMAPTELLAEQHVHTFQKILAPLNIRVEKRISKQKGSDKKAILADLAAGEIQLLIGTHALIQDDTVFHRLGLIIIDEQHRFGVEQRYALQKKGQHPHQLVMTATPIPRTLAMTAYADLDVSVLDELPPGRTPIKTVLVSQQRRNEVMQRIQAACQAGRQVYWVCTLVEESDVLEAQAAEDATALLQQVLPQLRIGLVHGRLKAPEKNTLMQQFKDQQLDVLVATTVIEVGVDVPNASVMVIENAERLGLAQLHQLRGRVGRGSTESFCLLLYKSPLGQISRKRLELMRDSTDGFHIAEQDLLLRGPGEVLGTRQTGDIAFRLASLIRDQHLIPQVQQCAETLLTHHPERVEILIQRWLGQHRHYQSA